MNWGGSKFNAKSGSVLNANQQLQRRFIPTPVGNGSIFKRSSAEIAVHPHACGERQQRKQEKQGDGGSSPRLWGTATDEKGHKRAFRFIPTPVGNGFDNHFDACNFSVHPHACGERYQATRPDFYLIGSSPRLWGTGY